MDKLALFLLDQKYLDEAELNEFERIATETGRNIESVILSHENTNPYKLYSKIAQHYNLEFSDLRKNPCDKNLLSPIMRDEYLKYSAIPWKRCGDNIIIATSDITLLVQNWANDNYGNSYIFAIATPFDISDSVNHIFADENDADAREELHKMSPHFSAKQLIPKPNIFCLATISMIVGFLAVKFRVHTMAIVFIATSIFYTATILFKFILLVIGYFAALEAKRTSLKINLKNSDLPIYTILVPLYKEERTLKRLIKALQELDYPKAKLDVKLIVEADDELTINTIKSLSPPRMFEMIKIPYSLPRTKPKACNYALRFAKGEYVTIYDAEDIPDPEQLKKVLYKFKNSDSDLACVQAQLNYFNHSENLLTRMFAIEYSVLFDFMLFGLERIGIPIPLGGTSNHFRTKTLQQLYAWDPYNVTEDADLGLRISHRGWKCGMIWSHTDEESPISVWAWIKQRTRWIKGHMQTYLVHMRHPFSLYKKLGISGFMGMQFFFGAPTLIFLISPVMWLVWVLFIAGIFRFNTDVPEWFNYMVQVISYILLAGIAMQILSALAVIIKRKWWSMLPYVVVFPFYWILHSFASFRALWQLFRCPHHWEKTLHGVTKIEKTKV